jgi:putative flippase GtrA
MHPVHWQGLIWRLLRAAVVAGAVAVLNIFLVWTFAHFLGPRVSFTLAFLISLTTHFLLSKFWTFTNYSPEFAVQIPRYLAAAAVSYLLQLGVFHACLVVLTKNVVLASIIAMPGGMAASFTLLQLWVFSGRPVGRSGFSDLTKRVRPTSSVTNSIPDLSG